MTSNGYKSRVLSLTPKLSEPASSNHYHQNISGIASIQNMSQFNLVVFRYFTFMAPYSSHCLQIHIYTCIIGSYNTLVRITTFLLAPLMLCVLILYMSDGTVSLKSIPKVRTSRVLIRNLLNSLKNISIY